MTSDGNHTYTYDAENRIISVDGGNTAKYSYDAEGNRIQKVSGSVINQYVFGTGGEVLHEVGGTGTFNVHYIYFGGQLAAQMKNSTTYFIHTDHLGSTRLMTAEGPATRIQTSGGTNLWKYFISGVCPSVSGVTYTISLTVRNQGKAPVQIAGNIVNGPVIAPGATEQVSFNEVGNGVSCVQLAFLTLNTGDSIDVLAFAPSISDFQCFQQLQRLPWDC